MRNGKFLSFLISISCYIMAIAFGYYLFTILNPEIHFLIRLLIADLGATTFIFLTSIIFNNSSLYDPYWSLKPMVFAFVYLFELGLENAGIVHWAAFILLQLYGLRLTSNFYRDWPGLKHEDWRYVEFRNKFQGPYWLVSYAGIHVFPTIMVYFACLPLYSLFLIHANENINILILILGIFVMLSSIILAFLADEQMRKFRNNKKNKGKFMDKNLWKYSRHPNYFGEILTWWGLYLISLSVSFEMWYLGVGALLINLMFIFISIPWLDKRSLERREYFQSYLDSTRMLLPLPKNNNNE